MKTFITLCLLLSFLSITAQETSEDIIPYSEIPDYPETYTAGTVLARMIDGLGFRFYWATEGLREDDLAYKPSADGRTTAETIEHIYGLSQVILNSILMKPNIQNTIEENMSYAEKRKLTLTNFKTAADILRTSEDISKFKLVFGTNEFPFWNNINGPIEDAVWHCGQVVLLRRASGNPFNSKVSVLMGKIKE